MPSPATRPTPRPARPTLTPVGDTDPFRPTRERPVRVRARSMPADTHFEPHRHDWAQLAYSARGMLQVTAAREPASQEQTTFIVPPSRAVWIAPGALHTIVALEAAEFRTVYMHQGVTPEGWTGCRMLGVTPLLRELIPALDAPALSSTREGALAQLVLQEIAGAETLALGVPMPHATSGDKRLRALCDAVLQAPGRRSSLAEWAADVGASERTLARLFRDELGSSYQPWRQQVVLAHALPLLARGLPVSQVAARCGYASESLFCRHVQGRPGAAAEPVAEQKQALALANAA